MAFPAVWLRRLPLVAGLVSLAGCHRAPDPVVIGFAFPVRNSHAAAVARDVLGRAAGDTGVAIRIVVNIGDSSDAPDVEVRRAEQFVAMRGLAGVVGHASSRGSLVAAPVYNEAGVVQLTPYATSRLLRTAGPWTFNLAPDDSVEGAFIGDFTAGRLRARRVTIYFVNDEYGLGLRDGVVAELRHRGVAVIDQVSMDPTSDFPTLVAASLVRGTPDVVVVAGRQAETGRIARLMWARGVRRAVVAGDGAQRVPELGDAAGPAADSVYVVAFWMPDAPDERSRAFSAAYRRVVGREPESADAMSYDALMLMATAVREGGPEPAAVRRYLEELGRSRPPYAGVTGQISFAADAPRRLLMAQLHGGRMQRVAWP